MADFNFLTYSITYRTHWLFVSLAYRSVKIENCYFGLLWYDFVLEFLLSTEIVTVVHFCTVVTVHYENKHTIRRFITYNKERHCEFNKL